MHGGDYANERHSKAAADSEAGRQSMHGSMQRGLDYTPLFRFLLSKIGSQWRDVYSEAVSRLDKTEPIFWLVAKSEREEQEYVRTGESSYFSGMKVDSHGVLQLVNPELGPDSLAPLCKCCTHTFNGTRFTKTYERDAAPIQSAYRVA